MRKIFLGAKEELQGKIVKWVDADDSILIVNKKFMSKKLYVDQHSEEDLVGSGDLGGSRRIRGIIPRCTALDRSAARLSSS
jgi:hypothetical protein